MQLKIRWEQGARDAFFTGTTYDYFEVRRFLFWPCSVRLRCFGNRLRLCAQEGGATGEGNGQREEE